MQRWRSCLKRKRDGFRKKIQLCKQIKNKEWVNVVRVQTQAAAGTASLAASSSSGL